MKSNAPMVNVPCQTTSVTAMMTAAMVRTKFAWLWLVSDISLCFTDDSKVVFWFLYASF